MSEEPKNDLAVQAPELKKRAPTLYFIAGVKLLKCLAALALALVSYSLSDNNLPEEYRKVLDFFHIDPEKRFFMDLGERIAEITAANLNWFAVVSVVYGLFMLLQAIGLILRVSWVVWLVIGESAFFIPIEIFELVRKHTNPEIHTHIFPYPRISVAIVLIINVAIVWYLFENRNRIIRHHQNH